MPTKVRETKNVPGHSTEQRRGRRMNSRVPVRLEWDEASGKRSSAEAHTRIVNPYGCMVVLPHALGLEQRVALTNLATKSSNAAIIVWRGQSMMAALLDFVARLVRATHCSSPRACGRTTMQPYGLTIRVCASALERLPDASSHSR